MGSLVELSVETATTFGKLLVLLLYFQGAVYYFILVLKMTDTY